MTSADREMAGRVEISTIQAIPLNERHGRARDLFTVWFGSNLMLLTIVTGGLAVTVYGLPFVWAMAALGAGNLTGAVFMALHAAQGPVLGVPQMIQTRGQFGSLGSLLVVGIVILMYVGFLSSNLVLGGQALSIVVPGASDAPGIGLVAVLSLVAAIYGYHLIHAYARLMAYVSGVVLLVAVFWIVEIHGFPPDFLTRNTFQAPGLLGTVSAAALWQIAYAPYVSDYSRYMSPDTGVRSAFWATYWGCALGSFLPMGLGAAVGLAMPGVGIVPGLGMLTGKIAPLVLSVFSVGVAAANSMNLYCATLSVLTFGQSVIPRWSPGPYARTVTAVALSGLATIGAVLGKSAFLVNYEHFISLLLIVLVPWTAINLVDYYLVRHGVYDVPSFFRRDGGIYGRINGAAVVCYGLGILVQLPFVATHLYTGPVPKLLNGIDLSWIIGLVVTFPLYYLMTKSSDASRSRR